MPKAGWPTVIFAMLTASMALGNAGCFLPFLGAIPSVISMAHSLYTSGNSTDDAAAKNQEAETPTEEASTTTPPSKLTAGNICQMMALARPDMVLVELRKSSAGAPEYRELHLQNSTDEAHWTPIVDSETGPDGWIPAVNFLKMDFQPPLTDAIPSTGSCYLAYAPIAIDPSNPYQVAELKSGTAAGQLDTFAWAGRVYEYSVARTLPCLSPSS
jgi:hypothetical protein